MSASAARSCPGGASARRCRSCDQRDFAGLLTVAPAKDEDALFGEQIGQAATRIERIGLSVAVQGDAAVDADADLIAQRDKVADRAEMNVGGLVPGVGES